AARSPKHRARWVSIHNLPSMRAVEASESEVSFGAAVSTSEFVKSFEEYCGLSISTPIRKFFDKFSSMQVMNVASWAGGLLTGASDTSSLFLAFNAKIVIREVGGAFTTGQVSDFMDDQGRMRLRRGAVVVAGVFPRSQRNRRVFTFKQGMRPGADSTVVNCVGVFRVANGIDEARVVISFGSGAVLSKKVSQCLRGKRYDRLTDHTNEVLEASEEDISRFSTVPDFRFRRELARAAIRNMCEDHSDQSTSEDKAPEDYLQLYTEWSQDVVHVGVVLSSKAHAKILKVDASEALSIDGVLGYFDIKLTSYYANGIKDIPKGGTNYPGKLPFNVLGVDDTPMFADGEIMEMNFNKSGSVRLNKEVILNDALIDCWKECLQWSEFEKKRNEVDQFN
ncbi:FAD binding domain in molybdopterin dehydrogenase, partial [Teladorsagia circumcincta]